MPQALLDIAPGGEARTLTGPAEGSARIPRHAGERPHVPVFRGETSQDAETHPERPEIMRIVARAKEGDADAFALLYDRYAALVYRYVYYRVGTRSLAEDLTSETFLRALRRITSFTWQGRDFAAWLVTIARNLVTDHFKSGRSRLEVCTAEMLDADRTEDGPEQAVLDSVTRTALVETIRKLDADQRDCVVLRFLQGLSVAETALIMNRREGAVKALQYRAVRSLARMFPLG